MNEAATESIPAPEDTLAGNASATGANTVRRRLMLGAAAALPSVYTLTSGAQTAMASNLRCWARNTNGRVAHDGGGYTSTAGTRESAPTAGFEGDFATQRFTLAGDEWLRKRVYYGSSAGQPAFCAMDDQYACIDPKNPNNGAEGSVWIVNGSRVTVGPAVAITQVSSTPHAYGLVYVDQHGTVARLDPEVTHQLRPVTGACWASILGGRVTHDLG